MNNFIKSAIAGALVLSSSALFANDFIQFKDSDYKVFTNNNGASETQTVVDTYGSNWKKFSTFLGHEDQWIWTSASNQEVYWYTDKGEAELLVNFSDAINTTYDVRVDGCSTKATLETKSATVSTAAGTFKNVAQVSFSGYCFDAGLRMASFAPGVGLIEYTEQTVLGPVVFSFTEGSVKGKTYPMFNGMKVTADMPTGRVLSNVQSSVSAYLELTNKSDEVRTFTFNSSKQFDIVITDMNGVEVSRWSANKRFQPAVTLVTLSPGENHRFGGSVSLIDANGQPLDVGTYTLRIELNGTDKPEASAFDSVPYVVETPLYIDRSMSLN